MSANPSHYTKRAWIRRQDVPAGQPASGHFDCECGHKIEGVFYGQGGPWTCVCGLVYSSTGWILNRAEHEALEQLKRDAMRAEELCGVDECERFAEELRRKRSR